MSKQKDQNWMHSLPQGTAPAQSLLSLPVKNPQNPNRRNFYYWWEKRYNFYILLKLNSNSFLKNGTYIYAKIWTIMNEFVHMDKFLEERRVCVIYQPACSPWNVSNINPTFRQRTGCHLDIWQLSKAKADAAQNRPPIHKFHSYFDLEYKDKAKNVLRKWKPRNLIGSMKAC